MVEQSPARKIATQHRLIASLFDGLAAALSGRDAASAKRRIASLQRALDAHFLLEEAHYFPRLRDAHPEREPDLQRLVEDHGILRSRAERVASEVDGAVWDEAVRAFDALHALFQRHEGSERKVVDSAA